MSVTYKIYKADGTFESQVNAACFAYHYRILKDYERMEYIVPISYSTTPFVYGKERYEPLTKDEAREYIRLLRVMGLNFSYKEDDKNFIFDIPLSKNAQMHNKMILNCLRYLGEDSFPGIAKWLVRFSKEPMVGVNIYTKLVIAHDYGPRGNVNHMFIPWYSFALPMSNEEVKELILENDKPDSLNVTIKHCKKPFNNVNNFNFSQSLNIHFKENKSFKEIYKIYKQLCEKSM